MTRGKITEKKTIVPLDQKLDCPINREKGPAIKTERGLVGGSLTP